MKRLPLILTIATTVCLLLASCGKDTVTEKNYADDFVGTYSVAYYPDVAATLPVIGERELHLGPIGATAQIVKDGDYGDVLLIMNGDTTAGICYKRGLKLEAQTDIRTLNLASLSISYVFLLSHPVITAPQNNVMQWTAATQGSITMLGYTGTVEGTTRFTATKQ